ncbi:MAG: hypothetical protein JSS72_13545 [Armatimonadetes bacterium]|nr:hypothetical protein [Armatimonadota bacterium]
MKRLIVALAVVLFGCFQMGLPSRLSVFSLTPNYLLVLLAIVAIFSDRKGGAIVGFFCGAIEGSLVGINLTHYIASRVITGFILGWMNDLKLQRSVLLAVLTTVGGTLAAQVILMFIAPPPEIIPFLGATIKTAMYNGVIAIPVYVLARPIAELRV